MIVCAYKELRELNSSQKILMDAVEFCIHPDECDLMIYSILKYNMDDMDEPLMDAADLYIIHEAA